ncbi:WD40 repeat-like protein [Clathrospora elynae]|uniref:ASTRA-associated protein 1 n=1 Tax=Clathrospora elynae TaxID=706981 RepID=A0A6A5S964_9PLEO|nr:WD40 repeat-like protein [Clathrospora elynae]
MAAESQSSTKPPAWPSCILRGHASQIHSTQFVRQNSRLLTGDAEGWVIYWQVENRRAIAVWKAHHGPILGTAEWGRDKIITHGRDNSLRIWQIRPQDEDIRGDHFSIILPTDPRRNEKSKPWLLHALPVNTLNFCAFSMCHEHLQNKAPPAGQASLLQDSAPSTSFNESILVAVPARDDKMIEVYQLPNEKLRAIIPRVQSTVTGMVMAVKLVRHQASNSILVLAGYEGGITAVFRLSNNCYGPSLATVQIVYFSQPHKQPILSLDASPDGNTYFTSSADSIIAMHRIMELPTQSNIEHGVSGPEKEGNSPSSFVSTEQASFQRREDGFARPPHNQLSFPEQDVQMLDDPAEPLSFSKQSLSYMMNSSSASTNHTIMSSQMEPPKPAGLSSLFSSCTPQPKIKPAPPLSPSVTLQPPFKQVDTKHAGQQCLRVRSDGRLLATGGWDTRIRIYSTRTLKEVAMLKWHKEGVYAVGFSEILEPRYFGEDEEDPRDKGRGYSNRAQTQREEQTRLKHLIVAGSKDGKVSLWEVF